MRLDINSESQNHNGNSTDKISTQKSMVNMLAFKNYFSRVRNNPKFITCLEIVFSIEQQSDNPLNPSVFFFDETTGQLKIQTSDPEFEDTYDL